MSLTQWGGVGGAGLFQEKPHSLQNNVRTSLEKKKRGSGVSWASRPETTAQGEWGRVRRCTQVLSCLTLPGERVTSRACIPVGTRICALGSAKGQHVYTSEPSYHLSRPPQLELQASTYHSLHEPALVTILRVNMEVS